MHYARRVVCCCLVAVLAVTGTAAAAEGPIVRGAYGNPWAADGLGNLEIGKAAGRQVSYRFRADATGTLTAVRVFFIYASGGYAAGNGGQVKIALKSDAGGRPAGVELASARVRNPKAANFRTVHFAKPAAVTAGRVYHLVFTNPGRNPTNNYVSIDDLWRSSAVTPMQPTVPDKDLAVLLKYGGSSSWSLLRQHTPIFTLVFQNGTAHGPGAPYVNARSSSGVRKISGSSQVAQTMKPAAPVRATGAAFRVRRTRGSGSIALALRNATGAAVRSCNATVSGTTWARCTFSAPVTLRTGRTYRLAASTSSGSFRAWPLTERLGGPWQFRQGYAQYSTNRGASWSTPSTHDDFQAYLTVPER